MGCLLGRLPPLPGALASLRSLPLSFRPQYSASARLCPLAEVCRSIDAGRRLFPRLKPQSSHLRLLFICPLPPLPSKCVPPWQCWRCRRARERAPPHPLLPIPAATRGFTAAAGGDSDAWASSAARSPASPASGKRLLPRGWSLEQC